MIEIQPGILSHTDIVMDTARQWSDTDDIADYEKLQAEREAEYAQMALMLYHPGLKEEKLDIMAANLRQVIRFEGSRRGAHFHRYRMMTHASSVGMLLDAYDPSLSLPERGLLDLKARTGDMTDQEYETAKLVFGGKGIAAELGHVDQFGDWDAARPLDAAMRDLPESEALHEADFVFTNRFDSKGQAKISYGFNSAGPVSVIKRKRAAADVHAVNERTDELDTFEIVKQSSFLVSEEHLSPAHRQVLSRIKTLGGIKDPNKDEEERFDAAVQEFGMGLVEPLIGDRIARERQSAVIAATSLYFALYRHQ